MTQAPINPIATPPPRLEVHEDFPQFARYQITAPRTLSAYARLAERSQIRARYSVLEPRADATGTIDEFYLLDRFPTTGERMQRYEREAPALAETACLALGLEDEGPGITHLV